MPRTTNNQYLSDRDWISQLWVDDKILFGELTPTAQWQLQQYFQPSLKLDDAALLGYRTVISQINPSLPQRAGRALAQLKLAVEERAADQAAPKQPISIGPNRHVSKAVVKPNLDLDRVARVFMRLAEQQDDDASDRSAA